MKKVSAIVLCAGLSTRMEKFKPLLLYKGTIIINHIVETLLSSIVYKITLVTGHNADMISREIKQPGVNVVYNDKYYDGMHTSVMCGVNNIPEDADAFLLMLVDQPHITVSLINDLINYYQKSDKGIIIPAYSNRGGHPIIIDKRYFNEARNLNPNTGLKQLMINHTEDIAYMTVNNDNILFDIDTPEDYKKLLEQE